MDALQIYLFGTVRVTESASGGPVRLTPAVQGLLAYLVVHRGRFHARHALAGVFWGDHTEERARSCLNTSLWRLRQVLEPTEDCRGAFLVTRPGGEVGFDPDGHHWIDVAAFEDGVRPAVDKPFHAVEPEEAEGMERAAELFTADPLEGFDHDWALREKERLRCLYLQALGCLMRYHGYRGDYQRSVLLGQRILGFDPLREEVHRYLMRLHLEMGDRAAAVRQYEACRETLRRELGMEPMEETRAMRARIAARGPVATPDGAMQAASQPLGEALRRLRAAVRGFDQAQEALRDAVELVARVAPGEGE